MSVACRAVGVIGAAGGAVVGVAVVGVGGVGVRCCLGCWRGGLC